jgi:hypothetical protein
MLSENTGPPLLYEKPNLVEKRLCKRAQHAAPTRIRIAAFVREKRFLMLCCGRSPWPFAGVTDCSPVTVFKPLGA